MKLNFNSCINSSAPRHVSWLINGSNNKFTIITDSIVWFPELIILELNGKYMFKVHSIKDKYVYKLSTPKLK